MVNETRAFTRVRVRFWFSPSDDRKFREEKIEFRLSSTVLQWNVSLTKRGPHLFCNVAVGMLVATAELSELTAVTQPADLRVGTNSALNFPDFSFLSFSFFLFKYNLNFTICKNIKNTIENN